MKYNIIDDSEGKFPSPITDFPEYRAKLIISNRDKSLFLREIKDVLKNYVNAQKMSEYEQKSIFEDVYMPIEVLCTELPKSLNKDRFNLDITLGNNLFTKFIRINDAKFIINLDEWTQKYGTYNEQLNGIKKEFLSNLNLDPNTINIIAMNLDASFRLIDPLFLIYNMDSFENSFTGYRIGFEGVNYYLKLLYPINAEFKLDKSQRLGTPNQLKHAFLFKSHV